MKYNLVLYQNAKFLGFDHSTWAAHSPDNSPTKWAEFFILDQSSVLGSKTNKKFRLNSYIKNRGAQALRALYPSHKVRQGGII